MTSGRKVSPPEFNHHTESLADYARRVGVRPGDRLSDTNLCPSLTAFFEGIDNHVDGNSRSFSLQDVADDLNSIGVTSASGLTVTAAHVSNTRRKCLGQRCVRKYEKPTYKGRNWNYFTKHTN